MTDKEKRLEDFGEYIAGAKKEIFKAIDVTSEDTKKLPLSKLWPDKDIFAIEDKQISATAFVLKNDLSNKPRKIGRLNEWLLDLYSKQSFVIDLLEKNNPKYTYQKLSSIKDTKVQDKIHLLSQLDREHWKSIGDMYFFQKANLDNAVHFSVKIDGKEHTFLPKKPATITNYNSKAIIDEFASSISDIIKQNKQEKEKIPKPSKQMTASSFDIYTRRIDDSAFICAKTDRQKTPLVEFETLEQARQYLKDPENIAELSRRWTAHREHNSITKADMRNAVNEERTGQSYREHDITPDEFMQTFGIRGGQFGNWVTGDERQKMLNATYDGFMDLSKALSIEPKAIGLDGTLGIAFGARGSGNASAHYERSEQVINLTKTRGAGSLAHEWWHALDHYMKNGDDLLTRHLNANSTARHQELIAPTSELIKDIHKSDLYSRSQTADAYRNQPYFATDVEMTARAFEGHIQHTLSTMGIKNDFLVNIKAKKDWQKNLDAYPYPKADELKRLSKAYNAVFDTLKEVGKEFVPVRYEPEQIIHADTLAVTDTEKTKENLAQNKHDQENISFNIIAKDFSNDPASREVQDRVMALAKQYPQELIKIYTEMSPTFNGRYIASDMMKEVFEDFNQSPAHRNQFNNAVHNSAATLSALHFEQMINEPVVNGRDTVVFLTGCPGAGKTSSVMNNDGLDETTKVVFEGQLANAHISNAPIQKIQQALDNNLKVKIVAVNPLPEQALENTFKRYYDPNDGRGAPISTMARIQGNTYDGLKAIYDKFADKVELHIVDKPDGNKKTIKYAGWQHLDVLKSQGTEVDITKRLENHLINHYSQGKIDYECFEQSAGSDDRAKQLISTMARPLNQSERENGNGREISSGSRQKSNTEQGRSSSPASQTPTNITNSQAKPNLSTQNTYINCPYAEKNEAKALGAKWDNANKSWYVPQGIDLNKFEKWLPKEKEQFKQSNEKLANTPAQTPQGQTNNTSQSQRLYLYTRPSDNEKMQELKTQGIIKFDLANKLWYAYSDNAEAIKEWTTRPNVPTPKQALTEHLRSMGIAVATGHPIFDERPHRLANEGSTDKNVMYHAYPNPNGVPYARITNFSRNGVSEWTYPIEHVLSLRAIEAVERANGGHAPIQNSYTPKTATAPQKDPEKTALENKMAQRAKMLMSFAPVADTKQNYLAKKQVTANNVARIVPDSSSIPEYLQAHITIGNTPKQYFYLLANNPDNKLVLQRGNLVVPQTNVQGEIRAFETIAYNSRKYALKDAEKKSMMTALGSLEDGKPIIMAEGYATGATLHENTGQSVVVAFGKNGLMDIAKELRNQYPNSKIYIGADNDHNKEVNAGLVDAVAVQQVVQNVYILVPQFEKGDTGKDWNDVLVDKGVDELKHQIKEQLAVINPQNVNKAQNQDQLRQPAHKTIQKHPLDPDVIRQNYPTISEDNINTIQMWRKEISLRYTNEPIRAQFALSRLENKLSQYARGEVLPAPKLQTMEQKPPENTVSQPTLQVQQIDNQQGGWKL